MRRALFGPFGPLALIRVGLMLGIVGLLGGCSSSSFLGRHYTNFTAYYNKFHNANKAFKEGLKSIEGGNQPVDRTQYMSVFPRPEDRAGGGSFEKAIQKSADVLREHPNSKWVDDALLLIGKSYFYQKNYVGAAQKFREAIALKEERTKEARFWLARTLVATRQYNEAEKVIRTGLQGADLGPWTARLYLVRGQLLVRREQWNEAAQALNQGLQAALPDEVGARGAFLLGQVLETIGKPTPARAAYQKVQDYDPRYALGFAARLNDIELQGKHGNTARALDRLRDLERDEKNYKRRGEMALVRARIYRAQEQYDRARRVLKNMLYGEESVSGASQGRLHYDLARLYRDAYKDFSQAAAHFDTASTTLGSAGRRRGESDEVQHLPNAPVDPGTQADRYRNLAKRARNVARMDSLLRVGRMSDKEFQVFVQKLRRRRQAKLKAQKEKRQRARQSQQLQGGSGRALAERRQQAAPAADTRSSDAGFLFYNDPARVQEGRRQFEQTWGDRPRVDNWRRRNAIRGSQSASSEGAPPEEGTQSASSTADEASAQRSSDKASALDLSAIPRDSASQAKMEAERAVARYKLANSLFLAAGRPDSAATWYRRILQENGDHPVAKRALYALAEAYRAQGDTTAAHQAYRRLIERHPDTDLAARARRRLGMQKETPADNRTALADTAYAHAYETWHRGALDAAFPKLLDVAVRYPDTDAAPRALLAAGIVYWKQLQRDSTSASRKVLERHLRSLRSPDSTASAQNAPPSDRTKTASQSARSDSTVADSVLATNDSTRSTGPNVDSTQSPKPGVDTTQSPESAPRDSLRAVDADSIDGTGRSGRSNSDSARASPDTAASSERGPPADSARQAASVPPETDEYTPLDSLLTYLTERYPDAPQVKRARVMLKLIEKRRAGADSARADTTIQKPLASDTTAARKTIAEKQETEQRKQARRDSLATGQASVASDTTRTAPSGQTAERTDDSDQNNRDPKERAPLPAPTGVKNQPDETAKESIDRSRGGWTLLVQTFTSSQEASTRVADVGRQLGDRWPVDLLKETQNDETQYRLFVGQFQSKRAAAQAQKRVAKQLSTRPEVWSLSEENARP